MSAGTVEAGDGRTLAFEEAGDPAGARLPERVTRVACVVGGAPYDAEDLDWFEGMESVNVKELGWALAGEGTLAPELQRQAQECLDQVDEDPTALLADVELSESDRAVLDDPGVRPRRHLTSAPSQMTLRDRADVAGPGC